ncbi:MAG: PA2779 family protein [Desulfobacterales bacterium]|nr:PA2779 family protein [Desulfobacterales bacterium]MDD3083164.1 PA2779 family protein [Desulfobacterales bacterium]MDD4463372.1 PA2779 family protein [Desulfobacterales bacterium]MDY0377281.1 PA2779 family protein [Desulfobacterales bacterium]
MATYIVLFTSAPAVAGLIHSIPSSVQMSEAVRGAEIDSIQKVLEMQIVTDRLIAYGLSADEVKSKLQGMSDEQLQLMAQASDRVLAGGDGLGVVIGILVIVILVIIIMKLMDKKIIIK